MSDSLISMANRLRKRQSAADDEDYKRSAGRRTELQTRESDEDGATTRYSKHLPPPGELQATATPALTGQEDQHNNLVRVSKVFYTSFTHTIRRKRNRSPTYVWTSITPSIEPSTIYAVNGKRLKRLCSVSWATTALVLDFVSKVLVPAPCPEGIPREWQPTRKTTGQDIY